MADVFISYSRSDGNIMAEQLSKALDTLGWVVWFDHYMHPGKEIRSVIEEELNKALCVLVLWSRESVKSRWVVDEATIALRKKTLIPVLIDGTMPPLGFSSIYALDLNGWTGEHDCSKFKCLVEEISQLVPHSSDPESGTQRPNVYPYQEPQIANRNVSGAIRSIVETTMGWQVSTLQNVINAFGIDRRHDVHAAIMNCINPVLTVEKLAFLYATLDWLKVEIDRREFFSKCGRWPPSQVSVKFLHIPDGSFTIGSPEVENKRHNDEHRRKLSVSGFFISETPITNEDFVKFCPQHPVREWQDLDKSELYSHPVVRTTWWEAYLFCAWVGGRLPTEAEWEYACRAHSVSAFCFGNELSKDLANFWTVEEPIARTTPVGMYPTPNNFGILEMHGNVWEWCQDYYQADFFSQCSNENPVCLQESPHRVARGGSWSDPVHGCRSAFRNRLNPNHRMDNVGFRVVMG